MSFIHNFLDTTENIPRKLIRILKLYKTVEQKSQELYDYLKNIREKYLTDLKDKNQDNEELLKTNKQYYKKLLALSEYKQNLIEEIVYIIKQKFIIKVNQIIEEGQRENQDELNNSEKTEEKKEENYLGKKTKRNIHKTTKKDDIENNNEEMHYNAEDDDNIYCICKSRCSGRMIMCDICQKWFHFKCFGLDEKSDPKEFSCNICSGINKENNNSSNKNKTTKKEKINKRKKNVNK